MWEFLQLTRLTAAITQTCPLFIALINGSGEMTGGSFAMSMLERLDVNECRFVIHIHNKENLLQEICINFSSRQQRLQYIRDTSFFVYGIDELITSYHQLAHT